MNAINGFGSKAQMRFEFIVVFVLVLAGCAGERVVKSRDLPVYGTDPLSHTTYLGSDDTYHYFHAQRAKDSASRLRVRRDEASIEPAPFPLDSGRHAFVEAVEAGVIRLIVLKTNTHAGGIGVR